MGLGEGGLWLPLSFGTSQIPGWASASTGPRCHGNSPAAVWPKAPAGRRTCDHCSAGATYRDGVFLAVLFAW